jgi:TPP-dependent pyruvate/acetoin dehydrogenase alpha subunit
MAKKKSENAKGDEKAAVATVGSDAELNRSMLRSMLLQRRFEERTAEAYALGKIGGFCHLYIGQEAVSTGTLSILRPDDYVITTYRDHGQALARGINPRAVMAELFGRADGLVQGKGGSMHLFDAATNFLGGHGIVGGHLPIATGVGFAIKYRGGDQVCVCFMGHSMSDAVSGTYRSKAELDENMKRDPIVLLRAHMHENNEITDDDVHKIDEEIKAICQDAWDFADASPEPPLEALYEDVLVDTTSDAIAEPVGAD